MDYQNDPPVWHLRAIDPTRNIARAYFIEASRDLFGWIVVERRWGRIGGAGRGDRRAFPTASAAESHIRSLLARRATAPRRIGVAYEAVEPVSTRPTVHRSDQTQDAAVPIPAIELDGLASAVSRRFEIAKSPEL